MIYASFSNDNSHSKELNSFFISGSYLIFPCLRDLLSGAMKIKFPLFCIDVTLNCITCLQVLKGRFIITEKNEDVLDCFIKMPHYVGSTI